ncbi:MAG: hypothetical protein H7141_12775 [Burkholderiales bacterium]|nr:hypothetical protein [Bacteroidia bacterium]
MKTSLKILTTILIVIINLNVSAQRSHNGNQNQSQNQPQQSQNNNQNDRNAWAYNHHNGGNHNGSNITVQIGAYPNYYGGYNYGYNNYYYSMKKAARNSIRQSANTIGQALNFSDWNDTYSPWLAKAIRHQQYAKQLYFWGDYEGALNHSERAGFLAWNTLNYFNDPYGYNNNSFPDPYSDPNNPYYRQSNPNSKTESGTNSDKDYGYRKGSDKTTDESGSVKREGKSVSEQKPDKTELDNTLPANKMNDRELLKMNAKDLDIE